MFTTGDIVQLIYGHHPMPNAQNEYEEISEPTLFLQAVRGEKAEVLRRDAHVKVVRHTQLRLRCRVYDPSYEALRDFLFPEQRQMAA